MPEQKKERLNWSIAVYTRVLPLSAKLFQVDPAYLACDPVAGARSFKVFGHLDLEQ